MHYKTGMFKQSMVTVYYTIKPGRIQNHMYNINQYQTKKKKIFLLATVITFIKGVSAPQNQKQPSSK